MLEIAKYNLEKRELICRRLQNEGAEDGFELGYGGHTDGGLRVVYVHIWLGLAYYICTTDTIVNAPPMRQTINISVKSVL
jgi:hypothetical protein